MEKVQRCLLAQKGLAFHTHDFATTALGQHSGKQQKMNDGVFRKKKKLICIGVSVLKLVIKIVALEKFR
jgi:hypothetical protein